MNVKEIRKIRLTTAIVLSTSIAALAIYIGYQAGRNSVPKNCAELGGTYLEIGKREMDITDFGSEKWKKLIESETKFTNDCYESLK